MGKQTKRVDYVAGPGILVYPWLNRYRDYKGDKKYAYSTGLRVGKAEMDKLKELVETAGKRAVMDRFELKKEPRLRSDGTPFRVWEPRDDSDEKPFEYVAFKHSAFRKIGDTRVASRPKIVDSAKQPIEPVPAIGSGTKAVIVFNLYPWESGGYGVQFNMRAVVIHELVEFGAGEVDLDSVDLPDAGEGGYRAPKPRKAGDDEEPDDAGDGDDDEDSGDAADF